MPPNMDHTRKYVLTDPRFVRPSMQDKVLSALDTDIANILNSEESDEVKAKRYFSTITRFKNISSPKPAHQTPTPPPPPPPLQAIPTVPSVSFKAQSPPKRPHKRVKVESASTADPNLWRRTQRTPTKKKYGSQWLTFSDPSKKKKSLKSWIV